MITYKKGNIFEEDVEALINPVNCVGVMGKGLALQFKKRYPTNFSAYAKACAYGEVRPGSMFIYETGFKKYKYIVNFPTKKHWRAASRIEYIDGGLDHLIKRMNDLQIKSIAIPPLGCGLGGLDWGIVKKKIESKLSNLDVKIIVFEPN